MKMLILVPLFGMAGLAQAQVYRCEQEGKITFSDQPCQPGAKASQKVYGTANAIGVLDLQITVTHYSVEGHDFESLTNSLRANGPKGFHGFASWRVSYEYTTKRRRDACQIDTVNTKVSGEVLMPRWSNEPSAPLALQRRWGDYYATLKKHEDGHIQHGRDLALLVQERLMGIGAVPCDQMPGLAQSEFQRLYNNLKTRDQEYDARTNHGATQGAVFK
jgi:predicted secreted Zn-dependent protease